MQLFLEGYGFFSLFGSLLDTKHTSSLIKQRLSVISDDTLLMYQKSYKLISKNYIVFNVSYNKMCYPL